MAHQTEVRDLQIPGQQMDLFDRIDRNHDGVITQSEINAAMGQQIRPEPVIGGLQAPSLPMPSLGQSAFGMTAPGFATTPPARTTTIPMIQPPQSPIGTTAYVQAASPQRSPQASASIMQSGMSGSFSPPPSYAMSVPAAVSTIQPAVSTIQPGVSTYQTNVPMQSQMQVQQGVQMGSFVPPGAQMGSFGTQMPQLSGARFMP